MVPLEPTAPTRTRKKIWRGIRRPLKYNKTMGLRVCDLIREGFGLREIAMRPGMPRLATLGRWLTENAEFRELHDRAREAQVQVFRDDVGMLAHALSEPDTRTKLRMDGRKWQVAAHHKAKADNGDPGFDASDAEFIARLEAELPRPIRSGAGITKDDSGSVAEPLDTEGEGA